MRATAFKNGLGMVFESLTYLIKIWYLYLILIQYCAFTKSFSDSFRLCKLFLQTIKHHETCTALLSLVPNQATVGGVSTLMSLSCFMVPSKPHNVRGPTRSQGPEPHADLTQVLVRRCCRLPRHAAVHSSKCTSLPHALFKQVFLKLLLEVRPEVLQTD